MAKRGGKNLVALVVDMPWWFGIIVAAPVYIALKFVLPTVVGPGQVAQALARSFSQHAWIFALLFLFASVLSGIRQLLRRRMLAKQKDLETIRALSWQEFEQLAGEAFRRQGYVVEQSGGGGPDGGVDLRLLKDGRRVVVQCKRWKEWKVGAPLVRQLFGVMHAEHADEAIFVSSGNYTQDAQAFAQGKPIKLIDGEALLAMIRSVKQAPITHHSSPIT